MGAHESNKGLCEALVRAFETMQCLKVLSHAMRHQSTSTSVPISVQHHSSETELTCTSIVNRLVARQCALPEAFHNSDYLLSVEHARHSQRN